MYNSLTKRVKIYYNVKFHKYKITYNTDISNKFQYAEFNKYKESEIIEIDIPKLINQNTFIESNIESFIKTQNINFYNVLSELTNTSITLHHLKCN